METSSIVKSVAVAIGKIAAGLVVLVVVGGLLGGVVSSVGLNEEPELNETEVEKKIVSEINDERVEEGLRPIPYSADLATSAESYSEEMVKHDFYNHTSPVSGGLEQRLACESAAENINAAYFHTTMNVGNTGLQETTPLIEAGYRGDVVLGNESELAEYIALSWLSSDPHRHNIMQPAYAQGVGVETTETEHGTRVVVTQQLCG